MEHQEIQALYIQQMVLLIRQRELAKKEIVARHRLQQLIQEQEERELVGHDLMKVIMEPASRQKVPTARQLNMIIPWDQKVPRDKTIRYGLIEWTKVNR